MVIVSIFLYKWDLNLEGRREPVSAKGQEVLLVLEGGSKGTGTKPVTAEKSHRR